MFGSTREMSQDRNERTYAELSPSARSQESLDAQENDTLLSDSASEGNLDDQWDKLMRICATYRQRLQDNEDELLETGRELYQMWDKANKLNDWVDNRSSVLGHHIATIVQQLPPNIRCHLRGVNLPPSSGSPTLISKSSDRSPSVRSNSSAQESSEAARSSQHTSPEQFDVIGGDGRRESTDARNHSEATELIRT